VRKLGVNGRAIRITRNVRYIELINDKPSEIFLKKEHGLKILIIIIEISEKELIGALFCNKLFTLVLQ